VYLGFCSIAAIVLIAVLLPPMRFLKPTEMRFLSSTVKSPPFSLRIGLRNSTISS
jgi:hypothetical protein